MGLLSTLKTQADKYIGQLGYIKRDALTTQATLFAAETHPGQQYDVYVNYAQNEWYRLGMCNYAIYRNVRLLGDMVAGARVFMEERDETTAAGWKEIPHEFTKLIDYRPNKFMSQSFIWKYQVNWLLLSGEAYWLDFLSQLGIAELYPLPANRVKPVPHPTEGLSVFAYTPLDGRYPDMLDINRVCFHRFPNPFEYWRGLSPLSAFLTGLKINTEAQQHDYEDYKNRLNLQHLITVRPGMPDREFNVALADLKAANEAGLRWKMIRAGEADIKAVSQTRTEYTSDVYKITESQANYIFGVPDAYWSQEKAYKQGDAYNQLVNDTVWPLLNFLAEDLTAQYIWPTYGDQYRLMFEDIRPRNIELDLKQKESDRVIWTFNEAREAEGLDPHPDSDIGLAPTGAAVQIAVEKIKQGGRIGEAMKQETPELANVETIEDTQNVIEEEVKATSEIFIPEGILYLDNPTEDEIIADLEDEDVDELLLSLNGKA